MQNTEFLPRFPQVAPTGDVGRNPEPLNHGNCNESYPRGRNTTIKHYAGVAHTMGANAYRPVRPSTTLCGLIQPVKGVDSL